MATGWIPRIVNELFEMMIAQYERSQGVLMFARFERMPVQSPTQAHQRLVNVLMKLLLQDLLYAFIAILPVIPVLVPDKINEISVMKTQLLILGHVYEIVVITHLQIVHNVLHVTPLVQHVARTEMTHATLVRLVTMNNPLA